MRTLVWFRGKDLRVADHAPLTAAVEAGDVVPLFVLDPFFFSRERAAELPHRMQYLLESLAALAKNVAHLGSELVVVSGRSVEVVPALARQWKVDRVFAHRWVEPFGRARDAKIAAALGDVPFELFEGETLLPPGSVRTGGGTPFSVFTPFARAVAKALHVSPPLPAPKKLPPLPSDVRTKSVPIPELAALGLPPNPRLIKGGERAARERLDAFVEGALTQYPDERNRMDHDGTSRISADLKFGTLSIRTAWVKAHRPAQRHAEAVRVFGNELLWREFAHHTLWDRPKLLEEPFRADFAGFPWRKAEGAAWDAWVTGHTGYPVVDAAARQLLGEGFVHNRARMISASFLTKHLRIDFRAGEAHYLKWLVDGDWAQNDMGWQWSAGCGCDAQPYFRVFAPVTQGERFDPAGDYVRRWVPELAKLDAKWIHAPWTAPPFELARAGVTLGKTYPRPIVDHARARADFLATAKVHLARSPKKAP
jgi:deoxyribodipyrimidine photo-lyase